MNSFLATAAGFVNAIVALGLIVVCTMAGYNFSFPFPGIGLFSGLFGFVVGCTLAAFFCGFLAVLVDVRQELIEIRRLLSNEQSE